MHEAHTIISILSSLLYSRIHFNLYFNSVLMPHKCSKFCVYSFIHSFSLVLSAVSVPWRKGFFLWYFFSVLWNFNSLALSFRHTATSIERTITTSKHQNNIKIEPIENQIHYQLFFSMEIGWTNQFSSEQATINSVSRKWIDQHNFIQFVYRWFHKLTCTWRTPTEPVDTFFYSWIWTAADSLAIWNNAELKGKNCNNFILFLFLFSEFSVHNS